MTQGFGPQVGPFRQDATYLAAARPSTTAEKALLTNALMNRLPTKRRLVL